MIPSATQAEALRLWVLDALNRDDQGVELDPPPFEDQAVYWGGRDHPKLARFAMLQGLALVGPPLLLEHATGTTTVTEGEGEEEITTEVQVLVETRKRWREWSVLLTVCTKPDRSTPAAEQLADVAAVHLDRVVGAFDGVAMDGCRAVGLAPWRLGDVVDAARLRGSTEWETRAQVVLTLGAGWYATRSVDWVESGSGTGEVEPLDPLGFDSAQET